MHFMQRMSVMAGGMVTVLVGAVYAVLMYAVFNSQKALPTLAFLCFVPAAMGAATIFFRDGDQMKLYVRIIFIPWMTTLVALALFALLFREAALCLIVLALPIIAILMLVTLIAWVVSALVLRSRKARVAAGIVLLLLPFVVLPLERRYLVRDEIVAVESTVFVRARPEMVWRHLSTVDTIAIEELPPSLLMNLGVPRPVRATVDFEGLGARRVGEFEDGLRFDERIIAFEPPTTLGFSVDVDAEKLRPHSTERHAFEAGYFRFVDAYYRIEPAGAGTVQLSLTSRYRMTTSVNPYGKLWAHAIIVDFQDAVLHVLKSRVEQSAPPPAPMAER